MRLLKEIIQDLDQFKNEIYESQDDIIFMHFGIGLYIRNKYLWGNKNNILYFEKIFKVNSPDEISAKILKYYIKLKF